MARRAFKAAPRPLLLLLTAVALLGSFWALLTPPWQVPDEYAHFAYTQVFAETGKRPDRPNRDVYSTQQLRAAEVSNANQTSGIPFTQPEWSASVSRQWDEFSKTVGKQERANGGGNNPAAVNPPLYYVYAAGAYQVAGGDVFDHLYVVRLFSVLLLLLTVTGGWLLADEVFGRDRLAQLIVAATCGMVPMVTFMSSSNNPDSMLFAVWTFALWMVARVIKRNGRWQDVAGLAVVVALAVAVKAVSWALAPGVALAVALAYLPGWKTARVLTARRIAIGLGLIAAGLMAWPVIASLIAGSESAGQAGSAGGLAVTSGGAPFNLREFISYLIQFYIPSPPFLEPFPLIQPLPVYDTFLKGAWGSFGWLEIDLPGPIYTMLAAITTAIAVGAVVAIVRLRDSIDLRLLASFALITIALLAGLHLTEYKVVKSGLPFNQGRYILPLIGLAALAVVCAFRAMPARWFPRLASAWLVFLFAMQVLCLAIVAERFYA